MRVIAGRFGGRRLSAPQGLTTRPTSDRVREALFSVLGDLSGLSVLDLYAGTGALGIEAISRGARRAVFVESARAALAVLRKNIADLGLGSETFVFGQPVLRSLALIAREHEGPFDLVLADPPYALLEDAAASLRELVSLSARDGVASRALLSQGARLVLEHASRDAPPTFEGQSPERSLVRTSTRSYGEASLSFYELAGM